MISDKADGYRLCWRMNGHSAVLTCPFDTPIHELLDAFCAFLVSSSYHPNVVEDAVMDKADDIQEARALRATPVEAEVEEVHAPFGDAELEPGHCST